MTLQWIPFVFARRVPVPAAPAGLDVFGAVGTGTHRAKIES